MRNYNFFDQLCINFDKSLRMLSGQNYTSTNLRDYPAKNIDENYLSEQEKKHVAGLMRVNYAGEVCAQALYQGQALTARNIEIKQKLEHAGLEESDHLYWCQMRLQELNSHVSYLNIFWYAGSFFLGTVAGLCGDHISLGFLAETEHQVVKHLESHLDRLPANDGKSRKIITQMRDEEMQHATLAENEGAITLPYPIKMAMQFTAKLMTTTAYWV